MNKMTLLEYARAANPKAPAIWLTNGELVDILVELADLRNALEIMRGEAEPHPVEEAVEIEQAIDAQLPYTRVFNDYLNGGVRYPETKAVADAVCEKYEEANNISNNFNFDTIKEIPF